MAKQRNRFRLYAILTIGWMILIFAFSARPADLSREDSHLVGMWIGHVVIRDFDLLSEEEQMEFADRIDHPVRKAGHASEYAVLGILLLLLLSESAKSRPHVPPAWILSVLYAASDEIHQLYVPGRSGQMTDVMIDGAGALAGICLILVMRRLCVRKEGGHGSSGA